MLDLDANIKPCPIEGTRFRPELKQIGGKEQVPLLVVNNFKYGHRACDELNNHFVFRIRTQISNYTKAVGLLIIYTRTMDPVKNKFL